MNITDPTLILTAGGLACLGLGGLYVAWSRSRQKPNRDWDAEGWVEDYDHAEHPASGPLAYVKDGKVHVVTGDGLKMEAALPPAEIRPGDSYTFDVPTGIVPPTGFGPGPDALGYKAAYAGLKPDPVTEASELFAKADAEADIPRFFVSTKKGRGNRFWKVRDRANFRETPQVYTRRSSALRAARRLNAKEAGR